MQTTGMRTAEDTARRHLVYLLQRAGGGDQRAFAELHAVTIRKLRWTVSTILGSSAGVDVEDVLQDVYLKIWNSRHQFDARLASPMTWMIVIARNAATDRLRSRRLNAVAIEAEALSVAEPPIDPFADEDGVAKLKSVRAAMTKLAPERAELLSRAYLGEESREALAKIYGAPTPTIKTWIRRSLAEVRRQLQSDPAEGELSGATA